MQARTDNLKRLRTLIATVLVVLSFAAGNGPQAFQLEAPVLQTEETRA